MRDKTLSIKFLELKFMIIIFNSCHTFYHITNNLHGHRVDSVISPHIMQRNGETKKN